MRYFITGHTGFKGAWLTLWLTMEGHEVYGLSLNPLPGSLFELADVSELCTVDGRGDIRDAATVGEAIAQAQPDVVIHMAAQPIVLDSYERPRWTIETNVMGTLNVLEAVSSVGGVQVLLIVTTDKVYRNVNHHTGYRESDPLGGDDPYSASKAMADILTHSWAKSFPGTRTAVARAGNVIAGGDVSPDRLIPDLVRHLEAGTTPVLRHPEAVRPWQHVLDCLHGYREAIDKLLGEAPGTSGANSWNFGPEAIDLVSVGKVSELFARIWGIQGAWDHVPAKLHETAVLSLDSTKAKYTLGWTPKLDLEESVAWTVSWYKNVDNKSNSRSETLKQIEAFRAGLKELGE